MTRSTMLWAGCLAERSPRSNSVKCLHKVKAAGSLGGFAFFQLDPSYTPVCSSIPFSSFSWQAMQ